MITVVGKVFGRTDGNPTSRKNTKPDKSCCIRARKHLPQMPKLVVHPFSNDLAVRAPNAHLGEVASCEGIMAHAGSRQNF